MVPIPRKRCSKRVAKKERRPVNRTILELDHDYLHDLRHSPELLVKFVEILMRAEVPDRIGHKGKIGVPGIKVIAQYQDGSESLARVYQEPDGRIFEPD